MRDSRPAPPSPKIFAAGAGNIAQSGIKEVAVFVVMCDELNG
jgi:hypothetical protein